MFLTSSRPPARHEDGGEPCEQAGGDRPPLDVKEGRQFVSATAGAIFGKAQALSEKVSMAMVSRGYSGNPKTLTVFRVRAVDGTFAMACLAGAVVMLGGDRFLGR